MEQQREGFFLKRPIFATVISIVITLVGVLTMRILPIEQYPDLTPPQVMVIATYNGANADTISKNVASVLESQINGVDDMIYMNSTSSSGSLSLSITFAIGTDPDLATINVNNRVQQVLSRLPSEVRQIGVTVIKRNPSILLLTALTSPDGRYDSIFLSNYAKLNVVDDIKQVEGVGDATNFASQDYSIRLWLNPDKMAYFGITPADLAGAIQTQNVQFAAGSVGEAPMTDNSDVYWSVIAPSSLSDPKDFENIILRTNTDGSILRVKDIARVELGAESYTFIGRLDGKTSTPIGVFLEPGGNAIATADRVKAKLEELSKSFPEGVSYDIPYDTTLFIKISLKEVVKTLIEAMVLVFIIVYVFLQNWRATLIPSLAVPVSIIGTFAGMYLLGFSINTLTMFAMVLSIGLVVDDAIIVLENVERILASTTLSVRKATAQAMREVTGPVIAVVFVLCSVFIPVAFMGGLAGRMYQQFAITIVISVVISGIVALTFTPALCMLFLKKGHMKPSRAFTWFNIGFNKLTNGYMFVVKKLLRWNLVTILLYIGIVAGAGFLLTKIPSGLVPDEDQGTVMGVLILPDGASLNRTDKAAEKLNKMIMSHPAVDKVTSFTGMDMFSFSLKSNYAAYFIRLKDWELRDKPGMSSFDITKQFYGMGMQLSEGIAIAFNPPPISGMSTTGGFEMWVQNRAGDPVEKLYGYVQAIIAEASKNPALGRPQSFLSVTSPQLVINIDREKTMSMGVLVSDVFTTLQANFGKMYINDFNMFGKSYRVYAQADETFRETPNELLKLHVRSQTGQMIPISEFIKIEEKGGANTIERFNGFPASKIMGSPAPGYSSGEAMDAMEAIAKKILPQDYTIAWSGSAYQEKEASSGVASVLILAMVMVFLILAAQYESWSLPLAVILSVPFAILGAGLATFFLGYSNDIYFQVALVTLIGLSAKNAILIVEFAVEKFRYGQMSIMQAAEEGARLRFRPIIMTSLAFIFGSVPLALSSGAGAASRNVLGTAVVSGMIFATVFAPLFIPYFFKVVVSISTKLFPPKKDEEEEFIEDII